MGELLAGARLVAINVHCMVIQRWYASNVNPKEITVSPRWLSDVSKSLPANTPIVRMATVMVQYRGDQRLVQNRPMPDVSRVVTTPELNNVASKMLPQLMATEKFLRENRKLLWKTISERLSERGAARLFHEIEEAAVRLMYSKSLKVKFEHKVSGKWEDAKLESLRVAWAAWVEDQHTNELEGMARTNGIASKAEGGGNGDEVARTDAASCWQRAWQSNTRASDCESGSRLIAARTPKPIPDRPQL